MAVKHQKILVLLAVCVSVLSGCGLLTIHGYTPLDRGSSGDNEKLIILTSHVVLTSRIECEIESMGLIPADLSKDSVYCKIYVFLAGPSSVQFDFVNDAVALQDGKEGNAKLQRLNTTTFDGVSDVDEDKRGFAVGFLVKKPLPQILEAIIPYVKIEGTIHKIPMLKFKYEKNIDTWGLHKLNR